MELSRTVPLADGTHVEVRAWTLGMLAEHGEAFLALLDELNAPLSAQPGARPALARAIRVSLLDPSHEDRIRLIDREDVLEAIYTVNGLRELTTTALDLMTEGREALLGALESPQG